jgi:thiol-disulfide isomerase/thioredoxin
MSKAARLREQSARERIAAQQASARRAERRRRALIAGGSIFVVIAVVIGFVVAYSLKSPPSKAAASSVNGSVLPASVTADVTGVPAATLDQVAAGSVPSYAGNSPVVPISDKPLTSGGKPEMLYIGAEYCPYCAAMRWSMAVALSRFGSFTTPLRGIHSSSTDTNPNTPTLTFYKAGYTSKYLTFVPVENENINSGALQPTTAAQEALWKKYDTTSQGSTGYPFIDFGNKAVIKNPIYDPGVLAGKTWAQVAAALHDPSSPIAKAADGAANFITASICKMTNNTPATVCGSSAIKTLESSI